MFTSELKSRAKQTLGGKIFGDIWLNAVLVFLLESAVIAVSASFGLGIGAFLVLGPLNAGVAFVFLNQARGKALKLSEVLHGFTVTLGDHFLLGLLRTVYVFLWSLLLVIPGLVKKYGFAMCFFIKNDHPELSASDCLNESRKLMKGHKLDLFFLDLSFLGWYIAGALCFGIGTFWVRAYHATATAEFYEYIKKKEANAAPAAENTVKVPAEDAEETLKVPTEDADTSEQTPKPLKTPKVAKAKKEPVKAESAEASVSDPTPAV